MTESQAIVLAEGQIASSLLTRLLPIIESQVTEILARMRMVYRSGELDHGKIYALIGEMCALEDIANTLKTRVRKSETIMRGQNNNAQ